MKYELIGENNIENAQEIILKNRNIDISLFNLDENIVEDYNKYDNIQDGIDILMKHIDNKSKICIVADSDTDGATSFSALYNYLKDEYSDIDLGFVIHTGKQHGLSYDIKINDDVGLVILPDASSNDFKQHEDLNKKGIDVLVIDHHECDEGYSKYATVINNQLSKEVSNKNLSGVGCVYKFLKALDDYLYIDKADYYLDLVALGNIADVMDLKEKETRYFVYEGLKNVNNLFIKALIKDNEYDLEGKYNIDKVGWTIAPKLNGVIRSGTQEEKMNMYKAFISDDYKFCLEVAKKCKNAKQRQDNAVKRNMKIIQDSIDLKEDDRCIIYKVDNKLNQNYIGLVAGKLADIYGVPILLYKDDKESEHIGGSARSNSNISETFREDLIKSNLFDMCQGHNGAFGWKCNSSNKDNIKKYINELYKDKEVSNSKEHKVDFILEEYEIDQYFVDEIASLEDEFGNGIDAPLIAFENIELRLSEKNLIGRTNIIFWVNNVQFIKKFATNVLKEELVGKKLFLNIVGKCTIDKYKNKGQIEVVDLEIIE